MSGRTITLAILDLSSLAPWVRQGAVTFIEIEGGAVEMDRDFVVLEQTVVTDAIAEPFCGGTITVAILNEV